MAGNNDRYLLADEPIELNAGRRTATVTVSNTGVGRSRSGRTSTSSRSTAGCISTVRLRWECA
jgi:hypothetical protein